MPSHVRNLCLSTSATIKEIIRRDTGRAEVDHLNLEEFVILFRIVNRVPYPMQFERMIQAASSSAGIHN